MDRLPFPRLVVLSRRAVDPAVHLCRPLVGSRTRDEPDRPWVAVAVGREGKAFVLATRGADAGWLIEAATATLAKCPHEWKVAEQSGFWLWKKPSLLRAYGDLMVPAIEMATEGGGMDDLSSDLVLREDVMQGAADVLGARNLYVIIPKRGWLLVRAGEPGELPKMLAMHQVADGIAGRGGGDAVSTRLFFFEGGRLKGWSAMGAGGNGSLSLADPLDSDPWALAAERSA